MGWWWRCWSRKYLADVGELEVFERGRGRAEGEGVAAVARRKASARVGPGGEECANEAPLVPLVAAANGTAAAAATATTTTA